MKRIASGLAAVAAVLAIHGSRTAVAAQDLITLDVVVTDAKSRPVTDLAPGDLELTDAGEVRSIDAVRPQAAGGRVIGILLDEFHVRSGDATLRARARR